MNSNKVHFGLWKIGIGAGLGRARLPGAILAGFMSFAAAGPALSQGAGGTVTVTSCKQDSEKFGLCTVTNTTAASVVSVEFEIVARDTGSNAEIGRKMSRVRLFGGLQRGEQQREKVSWPALSENAAAIKLQYEVVGIAAWDASGQAVFDARQ